jgi:hypothetical protein
MGCVKAPRERSRRSYAPRRAVRNPMLAATRDDAMLSTSRTVRQGPDVMKIIQQGELATDAESLTKGLDIPLDEIAQAFGVSTTFFMSAFESGQVEASAAEDDEGTVVITFRMGDRELQVGIASVEGDDQSEG